MVTEDKQGFPKMQINPDLLFHISNKYRSDKKEYRSVFSDKIHNRCLCAAPVMDLLPQIFDFPAEVLETNDLKTASMSRTELRE